MKVRSLLKKWLVPEDLDNQLSKIQKPVGTLGYDPWGFNIDTSKISAALCRPIFEKYFRVESHGLENVPAEGPVLIIANHSGQLPLDGILIGYAIATRQDRPRLPRAMIERFFPTVP